MTIKLHCFLGSLMVMAAIVTAVTGCSSSQNTEKATPFDKQALQNSTYGGITAASTVGENGFVGSWVHTYEYFDNTYRTTLVINGDGTAVYYNEEEELGNLNATWSVNEGIIVVTRSDGVISQCRLEGNTLIEITQENGETFTAEYSRIS